MTQAQETPLTPDERILERKIASYKSQLRTKGLNRFEKDLLTKKLHRAADALLVSYYRHHSGFSSLDKATTINSFDQ